MKKFSTKLQNIVSISGLPGLYKAVTNRANGLIVEDLATSKTSFVSARKHNFTPLETIAIYTMEGTEELVNVFESMKEKKDSSPLPESKSDKLVYMKYFDEVLPDYDEDRVHVKDMKKIVKWFKQLDGLDMLEEVEEEETSGEDGKTADDSKKEAKEVTAKEDKKKADVSKKEAGKETAVDDENKADAPKTDAPKEASEE